MTGMHTKLGLACDEIYADDAGADPGAFAGASLAFLCNQRH